MGLGTLLSTMRWLFSDMETPKQLSYSGFDGEDMWSGPDDLWPEEPGKLQVVAEISDSRPEIISTGQWGLVLPGGEVMWNVWQGIDFHNPLDRVKMIATLQKTALEMGFADTQVNEFLGNYSWATRNQIAAVVYEDTGAYSLTDFAVSAMGTPNPDLEPSYDDDDESDPDAHADAGTDLPRDLHPRPLGGPA